MASRSTWKSSGELPSATWLRTTCTSRTAAPAADAADALEQVQHRFRPLVRHAPFPAGDRAKKIDLLTVIFHDADVDLVRGEAEPGRGRPGDLGGGQPVGAEAAAVGHRDAAVGADRVRAAAARPAGRVQLQQVGAVDDVVLVEIEALGVGAAVGHQGLFDARAVAGAAGRQAERRRQHAAKPPGPPHSPGPHSWPAR